MTRRAANVNATDTVVLEHGSNNFAGPGSAECKLDLARPSSSVDERHAQWNLPGFDRLDDHRMVS